MGCDIHLWVEVFESGKWLMPADTMEPSKWHKSGGDEVERAEPSLVQRSFYDGRSYDTFAILANVRNGHGFAGVPTGEGFVPIAEPRGVPDDASPEYRQQVKQWGVDGHSHSWHTLRDLVQADWEQQSVKYGVVPITVYAECKKKDILPDSWSGGVMGQGIETLSEEDADRLLGWYSSEVTDLFTPMGSGKRTRTSYYVRMKWTWKYREAAQYFYETTISELQTFAEERGLAPDQLRIVFFFDN